VTRQSYRESSSRRSGRRSVIEVSPWLVAVGCLLSIVAGSRAYGQQQLTIGVGEQKILDVPSGSDISFTGPLHISRLDARRVKVIGDGEGWGSVTVKDGDEVLQYSVQVVSIPPEQTIGKLRTLLGNLNLTYTPAGNQVIVEGKIDNTANLERFNKVIAAFPEVINLVVVTAKEPLVDIGVTLVEVEVDNSAGFSILNISPTTGEGAMNGAFTLADLTAGKVNSSDIQVSFALSNQLLEALNAQLDGGRAKIIANPRIVTENGKEATISSGGEIPYHVLGQSGTEGVDYKSYGITLKVTPEARANDVLLQMSIESSEPVGTVSSSSENALSSRSVDMSVAVEKDKTVAIAGLYNAVENRDTKGGCLFPLFAISSSSQRRELIILVTPRVTVDGIGQDFLKITKPGDMGR